MKVVKRDGRLQEFDINKVKTSIGRASDDAAKPMNSSDVLNISREVEKLISDRFKDRVVYSDIRDIVLEKLNKNGFESVAKAYKLQ